MKLSNKFTLMRVCFAPFFFFLYFIPIWTNSALLGRISAFLLIPLLALFELTDYFDGHYARKSGEVSDFGKLFDPFADVMLNLTVFMCVQWSMAGRSYMPPVIFLLILYRELGMSFLRMIAMKNGTAIAARKGGKVKTVFYIASGFYALVLESAFRLDVAIAVNSALLRGIALGMFVSCLVLSYVSFIDYFMRFSARIRSEL